MLTRAYSRRSAFISSLCTLGEVARVHVRVINSRKSIFHDYVISIDLSRGGTFLQMYFLSPSLSLSVTSVPCSGKKNAIMNRLNAIFGFKKKKNEKRNKWDGRSSLFRLCSLSFFFFVPSYAFFQRVFVLLFTVHDVRTVKTDARGKVHGIDYRSQ